MNQDLFAFDKFHLVEEFMSLCKPFGYIDIVVWSMCVCFVKCCLMTCMKEAFTHLDDLTLEIEEFINKEQNSMELAITARVIAETFVNPNALLRVF